jgi:predicted acetyltransferase
MQLVVPAREHLPEYVAALKQGWSGDTINTAKTAQEELAKIEANADAFLEGMTDLRPREKFVTLPDGSQRVRIPSLRRWMWDEGLCGSINFRWQHGTAELPPHVLGHIGYSTVPWKEGRGYAKAALRLILIEARLQGLPYVELTADPDNIASQRVILANGGTLIESFHKSEAYGGTPSLRFRIPLA